MSKPLRVGLIGAGGIARGAHIPNYLKCGDKVELVAVADVAQGTAEQLAKDFEIPHVFASYDEMLNQVELDAVSICVPNKFHHGATVAALRAGCHVLCEKPPAMTVEEAEEMQAEAEKSGKYLTYGFHFRHSPEVMALKRFIDAGELGDIYAARVTAMRRRGIGLGRFYEQGTTRWRTVN